jgi:DNA-directed RNA polymerase beta' subunit
MVIQEPQPELEIENPLDSGFYWFFTEEEILVDANGKTKGLIEIDTIRWVPATLAEAYRWYMYSPNAAAVRAKSGLITICKVTNTPYENTRRYLNEEPKPDDWLYTELFDASARIEIETDYDGYVLEGPVSAEFNLVPKVDHTLHEITKQVGAIYHGMMGPREIELLSGDRVIRHAEVYETPRQSKTAIAAVPRPIHGGVADLRLGTYNNDACFTCGHTGNENRFKADSCPGHFGRINLVVPVPNYLYLSGNIDSSPLVKTLKYTCRSCHEIVLPDEYLDPLIANAKKIMYENKFTSPDGFALIWKALNDSYNAYYKEGKKNLGPYQLSQGGPVPTPLSTKVNHCPRCNEKSPILMFRMKFGMGRTAEFFPRPGDRPKDEFPRNPPTRYGVVADSLDQVPNDQALAMGFNTELNPSTGEPRSHPGYLFWRRFPIAPNNIRPPQETPSGALEMNDLNKLYINVVKANQKLFDMQNDRSQFDRSESMLFKACTQALSTQTPFGTPAMSQKFGGDGAVNASLEGVYDRIKPPGKKKNHIRAINQSKVTEHTMYSVIIPNPALRLDEVGVPIGACIRMTVAVRVTKENIEDLREAVIRGYPPEKKGIVALDQWDIDTYYPKDDEGNHIGGAKYIQKLRPNSKSRVNLEGELNGPQDPFALDDMGKQKFPDAQTVWYREILRGITAKYYDQEDKDGMEEEIKRARREYRYEFASNIRREQAERLVPRRHSSSLLRKNDTILFTRAPALHRQNVMAGKSCANEAEGIFLSTRLFVSHSTLTMMVTLCAASYLNQKKLFKKLKTY